MKYKVFVRDTQVGTYPLPAKFDKVLIASNNMVECYEGNNLVCYVNIEVFAYSLKVQE